MVLFFIGIIEMVIIAVWTKVVTKNQILASGIVTMINVLTWYYVLQQILADIGNWQRVVLYAFGCAIGVVASTWYFQWKEGKEKKESEAMV